MAASSIAEQLHAQNSLDRMDAFGELVKSLVG
jgi:hypothetical protein